jgi:ATP-dependent RNA helicase RhlE
MFKGGEVRVLVATDIAARGIDVDGISHVINFDTPNQAEDYIHRIGRTGRAEATGDAVTFVSHDEEAYLADIERHTGIRFERTRYPGFTPGATATPSAAPVLGRPAAPRPRQGGSRRYGRR